MKKITIYINNLSWYLGKSTDAELRKRMICLSNSHNDIKFYYPKSKLLSLYPNIHKIFSYILRKLKFIKTNNGQNTGWILNKQQLHNHWEVNFSKCDIIYSQGTFPKNTYNRPVLIDLFFFPPEEVEERPYTEAYEKYKKMKQIIKELGNYPGIYNVRSDYSLQLIKQICPENAWKFRNLPFLLPELNALDEDLIIHKHLNDKTIKILFCGAQAYRKGLDMLIKAFIKVKDNIQLPPIELHIISALSDGRIDIPKREDIIYHGALSHSETIEIFKKSHIYAMPSRSESFGLTYIEAMANGLIVIARNYEPQREIINYGECGILTELDSESIANNINKIINMDVKERINIVLKARKRFQTQYDYNIVKEKWHNAFIDCYNQKELLND